MLKKILLATGALLVAVVLFAVVYLNLFLPASRPPADVVVPVDAAVRARGEYLFNHVTVCGACHGARDWDRYGAPALGAIGVGGECWTEEQEFPGQVCAPNLTPDPETGLGDWSAGEILRAMREGVHRDGHGLFPIMPYDVYRNLSDNDALAIVAYLQSLPAQRVPRAERHIPFPASLATRFAPLPVDGPVAAPDPSDRVAYGEYLTNIAACRFCHTPVDESMAPIPGRDFAGGHAFPTPHGRAVSSNLTPHETGIGGIDEESFVFLFRAFEGEEDVAAPVSPGIVTVMPWFWYASMSDDDLKAIYAYLQTLDPIENSVDNWPDRPAR